MKLTWGQQKKLAAEINLSPTFVNDILNRRTRCPVKRAEDMSAAVKNLFKVHIPAQEFVFNFESEYPLFSGKPKTDEGYTNAKSTKTAAV